MIHQYNHPKCYMNSLGNCSNKITGEHYISRSILEEFSELTVSGFRWTPEPMLLSANSLQSNILCSTHNSSLSYLDAGILKIFRGLKEVMDSANTSCKNCQLNVNGILFERWMLKVLCGIIASGNASKLGGVPINFNIPNNWIKILNNEQSFEKDTGLFIKVKVNDQVRFADQIGFAPITKKGEDVIIGCALEFRGLPFNLFMERIDKPDGYLPKLAKIKLPQKYSKHTIKFHY